MTPNEIIASFNATVAAAKALGNLVKAVAGVEKRIEIDNAVIDLNQKILQHQGAQLDVAMKCAALVEEKLTLRERLFAVEKELAEAKERKADFDRYRLIEITDGLSVYALKKSAAEGEPAHWLCPQCYAQGKKSILYSQCCPRLSGNGEIDSTSIDCLVCGTHRSVCGAVRPLYC